MVDPTSDFYRDLIESLQEVVDEATDPKFKAKRQRRLDKMKAKRKTAMTLAGNHTEEFMPFVPGTPEPSEDAQDLTLVALRQILLNQQTLLLACGDGTAYRRANDSIALSTRIGEHLKRRGLGT